MRTYNAVTPNANTEARRRAPQQLEEFKTLRISRTGSSKAHRQYLRRASSGSEETLRLRFGICLHSKRYGRRAFGGDAWRPPIPAHTEYFFRYLAACKGERMASRCSKILTVILVVLVCNLAFLFRPGRVIAQSPNAVSSKATASAEPLDVDRGAAGLWQSLLKLHTRASLMMVTAHPDDEDGGMLTYESRGQGARVTLLTLNRGEGGQNVMSDDFWDALGLVRTEELLAADRYYDVQQFWSSVVDFGFSKTLEEALDLWGHDRLLADAVSVVRMTRPLVIESDFVGGPTDGHGHHSASGQIAQEVFAAAGDPNMFPEQIRAGLRPWSPVKMYARVPIFPVSEKGMFDSATGKYLPVRFYDFIHKVWSDGPLSANLEIPEGDGDPVLGATFTQIARQGWSLQKSQNGGGGIPLAAPTAAPYHRFGSTIPAADKEQSYFDGIDTSVGGIADLAGNQDNAFLKEGLGRVNSAAERAMAGFSVSEPEKVAPILAEGLKETNALLAQVAGSKLSEQAKYDVTFELRAKQDQFQKAIVQALNF